MDSREAALATVVSETGAHMVLPFNYTPVIEGQGTIALELLEQVRRERQQEYLLQIM